ncbi:hypothetical protein VNO78_20289 [Psophocarpus tetragonolobus]|uniref:Uncharacterized protein n=1 Tax=Psophocarpus tetragonolobus TaxID=3891 RepID=A0AAN9XH26_PSOTE
MEAQDFLRDEEYVNLHVDRVLSLPRHLDYLRVCGQTHAEPAAYGEGHVSQHGLLVVHPLVMDLNDRVIYACQEIERKSTEDGQVDKTNYKEGGQAEKGFQDKEDS